MKTASFIITFTVLLSLACTSDSYAKSASKKTSKKSTKKTPASASSEKKNKTATTDAPQDSLVKDDTKRPSSSKKKKGIAAGVGAVIVGAVADYLKKSVNDAKDLFVPVAEVLVDDQSKFFNAVSFEKDQIVTFIIDHYKKGDEFIDPEDEYVDESETASYTDEESLEQMKASGALADEQAQEAQKGKKVLGQQRGGQTFEKIEREERETERQVEKKRRLAMAKGRRLSYLNYDLGFKGVGTIGMPIEGIELMVKSKRLTPILAKAFYDSLRAAKFESMVQVPGPMVFMFKTLILGSNVNLPTTEKPEEVDLDYDEEDAVAKILAGKVLEPIPLEQAYVNQLLLCTRLEKTEGFTTVKELIDTLPIALKTVMGGILIEDISHEDFIKAMWRMYQEIKTFKVADDAEYDILKFNDFAFDVFRITFQHVLKLHNSGEAPEQKATTIRSALIPLFKKLSNYNTVKLAVDSALDPLLDELLKPLQLNWERVAPTASDVDLPSVAEQDQESEELEVYFMAKILDYKKIIADEERAQREAEEGESGPGVEEEELYDPDADPFADTADTGVTDFALEGDEPTFALEGGVAQPAESEKKDSFDLGAPDEAEPESIFDLGKQPSKKKDEFALGVAEDDGSTSIFDLGDTKEPAREDEPEEEEEFSFDFDEDEDEPEKQAKKKAKKKKEDEVGVEDELEEEEEFSFDFDEDEPEKQAKKRAKKKKGKEFDFGFGNDDKADDTVKEEWDFDFDG